jgi:hypothetical protein
MTFSKPVELISNRLPRLIKRKTSCLINADDARTVRQITACPSGFANLGTNSNVHRGTFGGLTLNLVAFFVGLFCVSCAHSPATHHQPPPFADIHLHYNWDQKEIIDPVTVVKRLRAENVVLGVVSSVPSDYALKLRQAGGDWIIPLFSPYITPAHRHSWYLDKTVVERARAGLESKQYYGIGELHLWAGMPPRRDNDVLLALFDLARKYNVPFLLHTETSDADYVIPLCTRHQGVRILWAHAGGKLGPHEVEKAMVACPNLMVELSARDPWRYNSLVNGNGISNAVYDRH